MTANTRREQREQTRERLLDAAMQCLVTYGHAGTTTQRIQDQAGVSRGAVLHHFASKSELLVAATHHTADIRLARIQHLMAELDDGPESLTHMVTAIRESMADPAFQAAIELWTASRTDTRLRDALLPAERGLGGALRTVFDQHAGISDPEFAQTAFESLMALIRGLELVRIIRSDTSIADRVISEWLAQVMERRDQSHP